jgi:hypothetical protein
MNIRVVDDIGIIIQMPSRIKRIGKGELSNYPKQPTKSPFDRYYATARIFVILSLKGICNGERIKQITKQKGEVPPLFVW